MEQIIIAHNFRKQNTANVSKLMIFIAAISLITFTVITYPSLIAVMFLLAPAIIMNVAWVLIHTAAPRSLSAI